MPERPRRGEGVIRELGEPVGAPALAVERITPPRHAWRVIRDLVEDKSTLEVVNDQGKFRIPEIDLIVHRNTEEWYSFCDADYGSLCGISYTERELQRDDWRVLTTTRTKLASDRDNFYIHARLDAYEQDRRIFSENWDETIARDLV